MATYARRINALGGVDPEKSDDFNEGRNAGLSEAEDIGAEADDVIDECVELIIDILNGYRRLADWADAATILTNRIKGRTAR